ncbi:MAG: membrane protein insertion efficiency factor YidD [Thiomargarita sp.]|nr:membrane protein insertion efficiency factor YidD [Thiomargarita sp.]
MQKILIFLIRGYQLIISPWLGSHCRFYPSCSEYMLQAIKIHGVFHGIILGIKRLLRCHPWHPGGVDPVPERKKHTHIVSKESK